jgi:hypothetical protein
MLLRRERLEPPMSQMGQSLPRHSGLNSRHVRYAPLATKFYGVAK